MKNIAVLGMFLSLLFIACVVSAQEETAYDTDELIQFSGVILTSDSLRAIPLFFLCR